MAREMKHSGIKWIGEIPYDWKILPNKFIMHKVKEICPIYNGEDILSLSVKGVNIRDLDAGGKMPTSFNGYQRVYAGNLLMCLFDIDVTPCCIGRVKNNGLTSPAYSQFVVHSNANRDYFYYYYLMLDNTKELVHLAKNLRHSITEEQLGNIKIILPPISEQQAIANFLDAKCAEIDGLLEDLDKEVKTLAEYKKSIIAETVTRGLNPNVILVPTNHGWIDKIPQHWGMEKFRYKLRARRVSGLGDKQVLSVYREYGVIPKDSRDDNHNVTSEDTSKYKYVRPNDFVINKMKAWQGSMGVSEHEGIVSPAYFVYEFIDNDYYPRYFHYFMRNANNIPEYRRLSGGIREGQWDLSPYDLGNMPIIIPPKEEQKQIVDFLDEKCKAIEDSISDKLLQIDKLKEYKASLIYEYVTGKKQVI